MGEKRESWKRKRGTGMQGRKKKEGRKEYQRERKAEAQRGEKKKAKG